MKRKNRQFLLPIVGLFVIGVAVLLWLLSIRETQRRSSGVTTQIFGSHAVQSSFADARTATVERLKWPKPETAPDAELSHYQLGPALAVPPATLRELQALFQNSASFEWPTKGVYTFKPCLPEYTVMLTFPGAPNPVRLALCLRCSVFLVFDGDKPVNTLGGLRPDQAAS